MNITPSDIRNANRTSGFNYVTINAGSAIRPFQARQWTERGTRPANVGPRRATAVEAAQDFCDFINGGRGRVAQSLKSAGHTGRRNSGPRDAEEAAALGVLRDKRAQRQHKIGYVYCITDGTAVKIGYSLKPAARVAELQTGNPRPLRLLATIPGTEATEKSLHVKYLRYNVLQEWFRPARALLSEFNLTREAVA